MTFYDSHLHSHGSEVGGFIIGLEGSDVPIYVFDNNAAKMFADSHHNYTFFRYVTQSDVIAKKKLGRYLKYHPRREKYTCAAVIESIRNCRPTMVIIDTLNEPFWSAMDYWRICKIFPDIKFLLAHAGGYSLLEFIKICHIQHNVFIDFSLTHTVFGGISSNPLPEADALIDYALNSVFSDRILLGSDIPYSNQLQVAEYYYKKGMLSKLNDNFLKLIESFSNQLH